MNFLHKNYAKSMSRVVTDKKADFMMQATRKSRIR